MIPCFDVQNEEIGFSPYHMTAETQKCVNYF
jgi:hypothetical protein